MAAQNYSERKYEIFHVDPLVTSLIADDPRYSNYRITEDEIHMIIRVLTQPGITYYVDGRVDGQITDEMVDILEEKRDEIIRRLPDAGPIIGREYPNYVDPNYYNSKEAEISAANELLSFNYGRIATINNEGRKVYGDDGFIYTESAFVNLFDFDLNKRRFVIDIDPKPTHLGTGVISTNYPNEIQARLVVGGGIHYVYYVREMMKLANIRHYRPSSYFDVSHPKHDKVLADALLFVQEIRRSIDDTVNTIYNTIERSVRKYDLLEDREYYDIKDLIHFDLKGQNTMRAEMLALELPDIVMEIWQKVNNKLLTESTVWDNNRNIFYLSVITLRCFSLRHALTGWGEHKRTFLRLTIGDTRDLNLHWSVIAKHEELKL